MLNRRESEPFMTNRFGPYSMSRPRLPIVPVAGAASELFENQYCPGPSPPRICNGATTCGQLKFPGALRRLAILLVLLVAKFSGIPLSQVHKPAICQSPIIYLAGPLLAYFWPFPNGSCHVAE